MTEKTIKLHNKQWQAFNSNKQFIACIAGKQGGKTMLGAVWSQKKISEFPDKNGLIAAPTYKILNQSTLEKFFGLFPEYRKFYKQQQGVIELPTGGRVFIRSTDEPMGLEGMTIYWAWLDEAGMMKRLVWQIIRARVSTTGGQILITTTAHLINWLYTDFYLSWKNGLDKDLDVYTWASIENPYFSKEFYEKERARLRPEEFARFYEGKFTRMSGLVYDDFRTEYHILSQDYLKKIENREATIGGIDWGFQNPSAIIIIAIKDKTYYVIDEFYDVKKTTQELIEKAKQFQHKYNINGWYPDPAEPDRIEEMKRAGLYVKETNKDVKFGISKIQQLIRENRFFVFDNCKNVIEELNLYHYDEEKTKEEPIKENDHALDAIRYAIVGYDLNSQIDNIDLYERMHYEVIEMSPKTFE